mmetsp:Transcript_10728/g.66154  ORF Transcript_10728/g.66154 Transcript_10728/m.66154 type:complete len:190 (+) Transcript_10728:2279-2848(+)
MRTCSRWIVHQTTFHTRREQPRRGHRRTSWEVRAGNSEDEKDRSVEEQFALERARREANKKRQEERTDDRDEGNEEEEKKDVPKVRVRADVSGQLERSRALQSEGLEGLPNRGSQLLQLGGVSVLAFAPTAAILTGAFLVAYLLFGDAFVHTGVPLEGPSTYLDPDVLLQEPTVDPYVPLSNAMTSPRP